MIIFSNNIIPKHNIAIINYSDEKVRKDPYHGDLTVVKIHYIIDIYLKSPYDGVNRIRRLYSTAEQRDAQLEAIKAQFVQG